MKLTKSIIDGMVSSYMLLHYSLLIKLLTI